jgi:hypothetical protein
MTSLREILPPRARQKYLAMLDEVDDATAALNALGPRIENARRVAMVAQAAISAADPRGPHIERLRREVAIASAALDGIAAEQGRRTQRLHAARAQVAPIEQWAEQFKLGPVGYQMAWVDAEIDGNTLRHDGESWQQAADRIRSLASAARSDIMKIGRASLPRGDIEAAIEREIEALGDRGQPTLDITGGRVKIMWPDESEFAPTAPNRSASAPLCRFHPDLVRAVLLDALDAHLEHSDAGIPINERAPRIAQLEGELRRLALAESALIEAARADGVTVSGGGVLSPMATLQLEFPAAVETGDLAVAAE